MVVLLPKLKDSHRIELLSEVIDILNGLIAYISKNDLRIIDAYNYVWEAVQPVWNKFQEKAWDKSILNWMGYLDLNIRLPELLLMRVDKMSMGVSLEARVPFLDHKLVELAMSIPESIRIKRGLKYILKKSVRGVIPDEIIDRKKQGFGVPVYEWVMGKLGSKMKEDIHSFCKRTDYFNWEQINKMFESGNGPQLWYLYNFVLWHKEYIER